MERTNEEKLDLFCDLLEPVADILADAELAKLLKDGGKPIKAVKYAIKHHKSAVIEILALLDGEKPEEYKVNLIAIPIRLMNLLNDPQVQELFTSPELTSAAAGSGSATASTEDGAK